jgi:S1-C subfamily serine protease
MHVSVPAGGPIPWAPIAVNALRVVLQDESGQLAAAGFLDGDLVVAIEGKEIGSFLDLQLLQAAARVSKNLTLSVQRGAQKVNLSLESRYVNDPMRLGGSLEPAAR